MNRRKRNSSGKESAMDQKALISDPGGEKRVTRSTVKAAAKESPPVSQSIKPATKINSGRVLKKTPEGSPNKKSNGTTSDIPAFSEPKSGAKPTPSADPSLYESTANSDPLSTSDSEDCEPQAPPMRKRKISAGSPSGAMPKVSDDNSAVVNENTIPEKSVPSPTKETDSADDELSSSSDEIEIAEKAQIPVEITTDETSNHPVIVIDSDSNQSEAEVVESTVRLRSYLAENGKTGLQNFNLEAFSGSGLRNFNPEGSSGSGLQNFNPEGSYRSGLQNFNPEGSSGSGLQNFNPEDSNESGLQDFNPGESSDSEEPVARPVEEEVIEILSSDDESPVSSVENRSSSVNGSSSSTSTWEVEIDEDMEEYRTFQNSGVMPESIVLDLASISQSIKYTDYRTAALMGSSFPGITATAFSNFKNVSVGFMRINPKTIKPLERFENISVVYTVLQGSITMKSLTHGNLGNNRVFQKTVATQGIAISVPEGHPHILENRADEVAVLQFIVTQ